MLILAILLNILLSSEVFSQEFSQEIKDTSKQSLFKIAGQLFVEGKNQATVEKLDEIEAQLIASNEQNKNIFGFIYYWKGICFNRLQEYANSIENFNRALGHKYSPQDLHYEYGQALFASEKYQLARIQFRESVKRKFKRAISLYYLGYISKEMDELPKAYKFLKAIEKLPEKEAQEIIQPAEMVIGDIFLIQVEKRSNVIKSIEEHVLPQYEKAYDINPESELAIIIRDKIIKIQRKYDLVLFQLRNGRPAQVPPYFFRLAQEVGRDSNVLFSPSGTTISKSRQSSIYSRTDVFGKYTFYVEDYFSISPELRFNNTYHFNRVADVYTNDNFLLAPAIRTSFEHTLWKKPASTLIDYDFNYARRDVNAQKKYTFNSKSHGLMIGERFNYFGSDESILRLRYRILESYVENSDSNTTSLVFEHMKNLKTSFLLLLFSHDRLRVKDELYDTDSFTARADILLPEIKNWFSPTFGLSMTSTDPINNRSERGRELLLNPSMRLSKNVKKSWRANLKYDYFKNNSKDDENYGFVKSVYAFELEYLF